MGDDGGVVGEVERGEVVDVVGADERPRDRAADDPFERVAREAELPSDADAGNAVSAVGREEPVADSWSFDRPIRSTSITSSAVSSGGGWM